MNSEPDPPSRPRSKRRDGEATRQRLIEAALALLEHEGIQAISTTRLTQAAGIVQSGFYAHFDRVETCLVAAVEQAGARIRIPLVTGLREVRVSGHGGGPPLLAHYRRALELLESEGAFIRLFLRYQHDPSAVGQAMSAVRRRMVADVQDHLEALVELWERVLPVSHPPIPFVAEMLIVQVLNVVECLERCPLSDREQAAHLLFQQTGVIIGWALEPQP